MAAFDATASGEATGASSVTVGLTTTGSDRALVGFIGSINNPIRTVSSFTYAAVSLGTVRAETTNAPYVRASIYCLAAPATGANNLVGTISANADGLGVGGVSATAVDQTTPVRAGSPVTGSADSNAPSVTVSSATDDLVVDGVALVSDSGTTSLTVNASQAQRWQQNQTYCAEAMSTEAGAASVVMSWATTGTNPQWAMAALSLANVGGAAATGRGRLVHGKLVGGILVNRAL